MGLEGAERSCRPRKGQLSETVIQPWKPPQIPLWGLDGDMFLSFRYNFQGGPHVRGLSPCVVARRVVALWKDFRSMGHLLFEEFK